MKLWKSILAFMLAFVAASGIYAAVLIRRGFSARDNPSWAEAFAARVARSLAMPATYRMKNPVAATAENLRDGEQQFADRCAICHGNDGSGDTLLGRGLYPKPPDMRTSETQNKSDGELYYIVENGVRLSGMPAFGTTALSPDNNWGRDDAEAWKLVAFIRHLPQLTSQELTEMKTLNPKSDADRAQEHKEQLLNGGEAPAGAPKRSR